MLNKHYNMYYKDIPLVFLLKQTYINTKISKIFFGTLDGVQENCMCHNLLHYK